MILIAQFSEAFWMAVVSSISSGVIALFGVLAAWIALRSKMVDIQKQADVQVAAQNVKLDDLEKSTQGVAKNLEIVHTNTNSMSQKLEDASKTANLLQGAQDERTKADLKRLALLEAKQLQAANGAAAHEQVKMEVKEVVVDAMAVDTLTTTKPKPKAQP